MNDLWQQRTVFKSKFKGKYKKEYSKHGPLKKSRGMIRCQSEYPLLVSHTRRVLFVVIRKAGKIRKQ